MMDSKTSKRVEFDEENLIYDSNKSFIFLNPSKFKGKALNQIPGFRQINFDSLDYEKRMNLNNVSNLWESKGFITPQFDWVDDGSSDVIYHVNGSSLLDKLSNGGLSAKERKLVHNFFSDFYGSGLNHPNLGLDTLVISNEGCVIPLNPSNVYKNDFDNYLGEEILNFIYKSISYNKSNSKSSEFNLNNLLLLNDVLDALPKKIIEQSSIQNNQGIKSKLASVFAGKESRNYILAINKYKSSVDELLRYRLK
ncbi:MAG: hypothetical protein ACMXX6_00180 [Candidatus Woesearchaeota archaeon]